MGDSARATRLDSSHCAHADTHPIADSNLFKCNQCPENLASIHALSLHKMSRHSKRHPCNECHRDFASAGGLRIHKLAHTNAKPYCCSRCPASFKSARAIHGHLKQTHGNRFRYYCCRCPASYKSKLSIISHLSSHANVAPRRIFACRKCPATFRSKQGLQQHDACHTTNRPFICEQCGLTFKTIGNLRQHSNVHGLRRKYKCAQCSACYMTARGMRLHKEVRHDSTHKPHICAVCAARVHEKRKLIQHIIRVHYVETVFVCARCNERFHRRVRLFRHLKQGHAPTASKAAASTGKPKRSTAALPKQRPVGVVIREAPPHPAAKRGPGRLSSAQKAANRKQRLTTTVICTVPGCNAAVKQSSLWKHKQAMHADRRFRCAQCCKSYVRLYSLIEHLHQSLAHSVMPRTKSVICDICHAAFTSKDRRRHHKRDVHGNNACRCAICGKTFKCKLYLQVHQTNKHSQP